MTSQEAKGHIWRQFSAILEQGSQHKLTFCSLLLQKKLNYTQLATGLSSRNQYCN